MIGRPLACPSILWRRGLLGVALLAGLACSADHIVSIGTGVDTHHVTTGIGSLVDVGLWDGAMGEYASPPTISGPAVTFTPLDIAPVVVDTIVVE